MLGQDAPVLKAAFEYLMPSGRAQLSGENGGGHTDDLSSRCTLSTSQKILQEPFQLSRLRHAAGVRERGLVESYVGLQPLISLSFLRQLEATQGLLGLSVGAAKQ